jgi:DNA polymerase zeta
VSSVNNAVKRADGLNNSDKGVPPPGAAVAYRRILKDPRDEPQYAERVPYIVSNAEGRRLIDRARMPEEMLANRLAGHQDL